MSEPEALAFEATPGFRDALRLRGWDEQAKVAGWTGPDLDSYVPLLRRLLRE
jgi:predicted HD phosphohydrolase